MQRIAGSITTRNFSISSTTQQPVTKDPVNDPMYTSVLWILVLLCF